LQAPSLAQLSPVSGLSFGGALRLWPALLFLDLAAFVALIAVLRKTWSTALVS